MPPNFVFDWTPRCGPSCRWSALSSKLAPPGPALRGGSGFGAGTSFRSWPCAQCAVGRSAKFGDTAELDGRDTVGASAATANPAVAVAARKVKLAKRLITLRERIEFAPHPWPDRPAYRHRLSGSPCMATNFAANEPKILMPSLLTLPEDQPIR